MSLKRESGKFMYDSAQQMKSKSERKKRKEKNVIHTNIKTLKESQQNYSNNNKTDATLRLSRF